ncbi:MAG TPA: phage portal protein [Epulopiscium sp.]|nr:phage portal protein [Candidatus Epulonipiscium sp.]
MDVIDGVVNFGSSSLIDSVLKHPAVLKVFALQCDLFSLGEVFVRDKDGKLIDNDPFLSFINNPNPYEEKSDFLWNYMFNHMLGNAYTYVDSKIISDKNKAYNLDSWKVVISDELKKFSDKLILSSSTEKYLNNQSIKYIFDDATSTKIEWSKIIHIPDLRVGGRFRGESRINALNKIIANSEASLDAENININYSGKFLVASENTIEKPPLTPDEKKDIEKKMLGGKAVHAVSKMLEIRRFVENMANLELDKKYLNAYYLVGKMYGIPRDVLEAYESSTFENQEKARGTHVSYSLQARGNALMNGFERMFGYQSEGKDIFISWDHLPFMQVFEEQRASIKKTNLDSLDKMLSMGFTKEEANSYLGTNF